MICYLGRKQGISTSYRITIPCHWHTHTHIYTHTGCVGVHLTLSGPFVWFQHQVLLCLFQFLLQTLVLGSNLADSLLPMLHQTQPGAGVHHLLTCRQRKSREIFFPIRFLKICCCVLGNTYDCGVPNTLTAQCIHMWWTHSETAAGGCWTPSSLIEAVGG